MASPETGKTVRGYQRVPQAYADATALGQEIAEMLIESGAGQLLTLAPIVPGGAD